jgi:hypothetical protein
MGTLLDLDLAMSTCLELLLLVESIVDRYWSLK